MGRMEICAVLGGDMMLSPSWKGVRSVAQAEPKWFLGGFRPLA